MSGSCPAAAPELFEGIGPQQREECSCGFLPAAGSVREGCDHAGDFVRQAGSMQKQNIQRNGFHHWQATCFGHNFDAVQIRLRLDAAMHVGYSTARLVEHTQNLQFGQVYPESFLKILDPFPFDYIVQHLAGGTPAQTQSQRAATGSGPRCRSSSRAH